ncbi:GNAT family N-acetyltransferase [Couchioplanes caeruleus]|uniref:GNAT family N-acetyltransferase n=1 Tax=Couchioplanes caeruleus TaxID=56438 RepID=UPI0020BF6585|nr:GNAT family N-acetyltransferase [Couchioplanes caeruleus]UQU67069.1 GNAT family N-acetyltransferase [Couchioplanes caeruleus]
MTSGPVVATSRLLLRRMTEDDLGDMAAPPGDPAVMRSHPRPKTGDEALGWIIGLTPGKRSAKDQLIFAARL